MMQNVLSKEEEVCLSLKRLYSSYGYSQFKMSKFEEYDLYAENKDFLVSDRIISFTDTSGKLMALKPDVTLSIIKNVKDGQDGSSKLYYDENVYRISSASGAFKEIKQAGLECVGNVTAYDAIEVVSLAVKSLALISRQFVLDVSHMGLVDSLLDDFNLGLDKRKKAIALLSAKNNHELESLLTGAGALKADIDKLLSVVSISGNICLAVEKLKNCNLNQKATCACKELEALATALKAEGLCENVNFDLSVVHATGYYSGIAFKGFIAGIPSGVLSGGRYDKLLQKMGSKAKAIGFAVYLDALENYGREEAEGKAVLVVSEDADPIEVSNVANELRERYGSVLVTTTLPTGKKDKIFQLNGKELELL